jgi:hypothetical protein
MTVMVGGGPPVVCKVTAEGLRCTIPPGLGRRAVCGLRLNFGLRGDFQITGRYKIFSLPPGEPGGQTGLKISLWDANEEWAQMQRFSRAELGDVFTGHHVEVGEGERVSTSEELPTSVTEGKLSLRRTGNTLQYLMTTEKSEELVELRTVDFSPDDVTKILVAAQCRESATGVDMVWQDLQVEADAVLGLAQ